MVSQFCAPKSEVKPPGCGGAHHESVERLSLGWKGAGVAWCSAWRRLSPARSETRGTRLGLGLDGLDAEKGAAAVGKSFIGLDLTPLARKSRVFEIDSAP